MKHVNQGLSRLRRNHSKPAETISRNFSPMARRAAEESQVIVAETHQKIQKFEPSNYMININRLSLFNNRATVSLLYVG